MATTNEYLNQLQKDKQNLIDNLNTMGVESYDNETFTDLAPKVLEVKGKLQTKTTKASESSDVIVNPDTGFDGMSQVTVSKIVASDINNLEAGNIKRGETILGVEGTYGPTSQVKNATPSTSAQVIVPDEGIEFMSAVNLSAVTSSIDSDIKPENIKTGVEILGTLGTYSGDIELQENKDILPTTSQQIIKADEGFDGMSQVTVSAVDSSIDSNIVPNNIKKGISILSVQGTYEPEPTQSKSVTPTTNSQIITPDEGYSGLSQVTVNAVTSSIDGNIQPENIKDGVNILGVTGSLPEFIPESIIINPTTEQQIITPTPGKTAITNITVSPVTNSIDSNIQPENIKVNTTILGVMGEYAGDNVTLQEKEVTPSSIDATTILPDEGYTGLSRVQLNPVPTDSLTISPTTTQQIISRDGQLPLGQVTVNAVNSSIDSNIQPENIKQNMSILGVVGTYAGDIQAYFGTLSEGTNLCPGIAKSLLKVPNTILIDGAVGNYLFSGCSSLIEYPKLDYSSITNGDYMFRDCSSITDFHLIGNSFSSLTKGSYMFSGCKFLSNFEFTFDSLTNGNYLFYEVDTLPDTCTITLPVATSLSGFMSRAFTRSAKTINIKLGKDVTSTSSMFNLQGSSSVTVNLSSINDKDILVNGDSMFSFSPAVNLGGFSVKSIYIDEHVLLTSMERFLNTAGTGSMQDVSLNIDEVTTMESAFSTNANNIILTGSADKLKNVSGAFFCQNLTDFTGIVNLGKAYTQKSANYSDYKLSLNFCNRLTHDSLMNVINGLYDLNLTYNVAEGGTLYTQQLVLGSTNLAKLTDDEIAIATNKGWTVS